MITRANLLLFFVAFIWGTTFVAQRIGMEHVGPMTFNAVRFIVGALFLLPFILWSKKKNTPDASVLWVSSIAGVILFAGAALQQMGLVHTTAGKAGFITGLYVVLVPLFGLFLKLSLKKTDWLGAIVAVVGLYFLSVGEQFSINVGDVYVLLGAGFWAIHILLINHWCERLPVLLFAFIQFFICAFLSGVVALFAEQATFVQLNAAMPSILFSGLLSTGIAYTLQVVAQKDAEPTHAAIIFSLEAVIAAAAGWIWLDETLPLRGIIGCCLIFVGILIAQLPLFNLKRASDM